MSDTLTTAVLVLAGLLAALVLIGLVALGILLAFYAGWREYIKGASGRHGCPPEPPKSAAGERRGDDRGGL